jgi:hypothetical protein
MGKRSKRPGRDARDVHAIIREQAETLNRRPPGTYAMPADVPEVAALVLAAIRTIEAAMQAATPSTVAFEGRTYWLQVETMAKLDVFDSPGASAPMLPGSVFRTKVAGHVPGH